MELTGKVALVTGASQGIGREIALRFAREGAHVVLAARSLERLEETRASIARAGGKATSVPTDVTDPDQIGRLAERICHELPPLDVVVSNSGIAGPTTELWNVAPDEWAYTLQVNVTAPFLLLRAVLPPMLQRGCGSIVMIGSGTGKRPMYGRTPYAASKLALLGLVRTLAVELGPLGLRANLISPGPIEGERLNGVIHEQARRRSLTDADVRGELAGATALKRFIPAHDVAAAAVFLASDAAGSITGEDMNVSAGLVMY